MTSSGDYKYRGARVLVLLHERYLREFVQTWRLFKSNGMALPETPDPDYASLDALLRHVLGCARAYMVWMCEKLELADPEIKPVPERATIEAEASGYLDHLLDRWKRPLTDVPEETFSERTHLSKWNVHYCLDAMLEHAVVHPVRHTFQLRELMRQEEITETIIGLERAALDRWSKGDPSGFLEISAPDVVYFDPFLESRLDGLDALTGYYESLRGKVKIDRYELINPRVQSSADIAVLTFNYVSYSGETKSRWNCTEVYRWTEKGWWIIQTHWAITRSSK